MIRPKVVEEWPGGSAAKTSTMFFGCFLATEEEKRLYRIVLNRILQLAHEGELQLIYLDNSIEERHVVVFRFTSEEAYNRYRDELVKSAGSIERDIWEPNRDARQYNRWLKEIPDATPIASF